MKHQSAAQYLYTLYVILFAVVLTPLTVLAVLYYVQVRVLNFENDFVWFIFACAALADALVFEYWYFKRLAKIRTAVSLGQRLENFYSLTIVRFAGISIALTTLAGAYMLLRQELFTWLFLLILLYLFFQWPTLPRISKALELSASEYEALKFWK